MEIKPQETVDCQGGTIKNVNIQAIGLTFQDNATRYLSQLAAGTVATIVDTGTSTALSFGTTQPAITLTAGTWRVYATVQIDRSGATVTTQTLAMKIRRTTTTAADVTAAITIDLPASTTLTDTLGVYTLGPIDYLAPDTCALTIFAAVSATMGAGSITAVAAGTKIEAIRLY